jgi:hypothetical protein
VAVILRPLLVASGYAKKYRHPHSRRSAHHPPSSRRTRVTLSHAACRGFSLGRQSISGFTVRNLSDRVSKNRKRSGVAQGASVTNHRQHTACASAVHSAHFTLCRPRRQPGPVTQDPETQPQRKGREPPPEQRRRRRLNPIPSISISSVHRQRPSLLCFNQDVLLIVVHFRRSALSGSSPLSQSIIDTLGA